MIMALIYTEALPCATRAAPGRCSGGGRRNRIAVAVADFDHSNQRAIDRLNQRGGRMLSLADLLEAQTLPLESAALLACAMGSGASMLAAAGPGGVGKTTLLGACLAFLPAATECVTVDDGAVLDRPDPGHPRCLLVHEIANASYYGYLWGPEIGRLFSMTGGGCSVAGTLHAESCEGVIRKLSGAPLRAKREDLARVDVVALMAEVEGRRRVTELLLADGSGGHARVLAYHAGAGRFAAAPDAEAAALLAVRVGRRAREIAGELAAYRALLSEALAKGIRRMELLRALWRRAAG